MERIHVNMHDMVLGLSRSVDAISHVLADHQTMVACIAHAVATEAGIQGDKLDDIFIAGMLHDCGSIAYSLRDRLDLLRFDQDDPHLHAVAGYAFLDQFQPFKRIAGIVRHHHVPWHKADELGAGRASNLIHLADRIAVLVERTDHDILTRSHDITKRIEAQRGTLFAPELVDAFTSLAEREHFWFDLLFLPETVERLIRSELTPSYFDFTMLEELAEIFCYFIDCRSRFTFTHSKAVARIAETLAGRLGADQRTRRMIHVAGLLHDLGKLAVPLEILDKPGPLTDQEFERVKMHPFITRQILSRIAGLESIATWAAFHHESTNGRGYPFRLSGRDVPQEALMIAVADVFIALSEDRPYRSGMSRGEVASVMGRLAKDGSLDGDMVSELLTAHDEFAGIHADITRRRTDETAGICSILYGREHCFPAGHA